MLNKKSFNGLDLYCTWFVWSMLQVCAGALQVCAGVCSCAARVCRCLQVLQVCALNASGKVITFGLPDIGFVGVESGHVVDVAVGDKQHLFKVLSAIPVIGFFPE